MPIHDTMTITADQYVCIKGVGFGTTKYLYRSARERHPERKTLEWLWYVKIDTGILIVVYSDDLEIVTGNPMRIEWEIRKKEQDKKRQQMSRKRNP